MVCESDNQGSGGISARSDLSASSLQRCIVLLFVIIVIIIVDVIIIAPTQYCYFLCHHYSCFHYTLHHQCYDIDIIKSSKSQYALYYRRPLFDRNGTVIIKTFNHHLRAAKRAATERKSDILEKIFFLPEKDDSVTPFYKILNEIHYDTALYR